MEPYPLPARPLPASGPAAASVDLRPLDVDMDGLSELAPWLWCVEFVRRAVSGGDVAGRRLIEEPIKSFDHGAGSGPHQLASVLAALDEGRCVAFYGWWPTAELASVSDILGVDAVDVPPPDRKGAGLVDGHAVVVVGYGRHDAFPGGGYFIVRNPWADAGWGDGGDGYLPFTYLRTYAIALRSFRLTADRARHDDDSLPTTSSTARHPIDALIAKRARCSDPRSSYTELFFSEDPIAVARAKAICSRCQVRELCLSRALERREPYGVWGGEFLFEGEVLVVKRGRGRPRKVALPTLVDEVTGLPVVAAGEQHVA